MLIFIVKYVYLWCNIKILKLMDAKKPENLDLVSLTGSKKSIEKMQDICAHLTGSYEKNVDYLKSTVIPPVGKPTARDFWTKDNIDNLRLINFHSWKKRAQLKHGRVSAEFPPNIAALLLWFGMFEKYEPSQT